MLQRKVNKNVELTVKVLSYSSDKFMKKLVFDIGVIHMKIPKLFFFEQGRWKELPEWGNFFLWMGSYVANYSEADKRLVVGIALPSRAFAASLLATGIVYTKANLKKNGEIENYFNSLKSLPIGRRLYYKDGLKKKIGYFSGTTYEYDGKERIIILADDQTNLYEKKLPLQAFNEVSVVPDKDIAVAKRQKGSTIVSAEDFLEAILKDANICRFALHTNLDCEIIGQINCLKQEIMETPFAVLRKKGFKKGFLKDILRVRKFLTAGGGYRSNVFSTNKDPGEEKQEIAPVAIFDGARSFINWRDYWKKANWVVILDRTEIEFQMAARQINDNFTLRQTQSLSPPFSPPPGTELFIYEEVIR